MSGAWFWLFVGAALLATGAVIFIASQRTRKAHDERTPEQQQARERMTEAVYKQPDDPDHPEDREDPDKPRSAP